MLKTLKNLNRIARAMAYSLLWKTYAWRSLAIRQALQRMSIEDISYNINISPRYKYVYMNNPKTGCSSLKSAIVELELRGTPMTRDYYDWMVYHESPGIVALRRITQIPSTTPLRWLEDNGYKFVTFVRNPYARLLSCYRDKIVKNRFQSLEILQSLGYSAEDIQQPISFEKFVRIVVAQSDYEMDSHWRTQSAQILWGIIKYDFVGRFESYNEDFNTLFDCVGVPETERPESRYLHKTKEGEGRSEGCLEYYTEELQKLVYQRYREDFDNFGYGYELPE